MAVEAARGASMARGFESKSVADQQESAQATRAPRSLDPRDPALLQKKRRLELARVDVLRQLEAARAEGHRATLKQALTALDRELARLG
jgi:hypothetical protein